MVKSEHKGLFAWSAHSIDGKVVGEFQETLNSQAARVIIQKHGELNNAVYETIFLKIEQIEASTHYNFEGSVSISIRIQFDKCSVTQQGQVVLYRYHVSSNSRKDNECAYFSFRNSLQSNAYDKAEEISHNIQLQTYGGQIGLRRCFLPRDMYMYAQI